MLDDDFNLKSKKITVGEPSTVLNEDFFKQNNIDETLRKYAESSTDEHKAQLLAATVAKFDIPFEQQAEKKMQVYEAARRLEFPAFMEWMFDKHYFISKL